MASSDDSSQEISARSPVAEIRIGIAAYEAFPPEHNTIYLYANQTIRVGRDPDNNDLAIETPTVSRNHLEFYSIIYEDEGSTDDIPMIYVRDRQSRHGTSVNGKLISDGGSITPARLLQNGDKITIQPHVTFEVVQFRTPTRNLSKLQTQEVQYFSDRFEVTDRILGKGAYARVHLAIDRKTGEQVACKIYNLYHMNYTGREDQLRRSIKEILLRSEMSHPNIASYRGAYKSRYTLYVFEELATGGDLFSLLIRDRQFSEGDVRWMVRQVVCAIAYMHEKGFAHRDLKLENILCAICPRPGHRLVVTDFGHSGKVGPTGLRRAMGTPGWQAPEILSKNRRHGLPVDIWSIGVLATQLLAGPSKVDTLTLFDIFARTSCEMEKPNYEIDFILDEVYKIRSGPISDEAKDFIHRCFQINPNRRLTAADALKHPWLCKPDEDLQRFLQQEMEATANWNRQEAVDKSIKDLPDLTQRRASGNPYFHPIADPGMPIAEPGGKIAEPGTLAAKRGLRTIRRPVDLNVRPGMRDKKGRTSRRKSSGHEYLHFKIHDISMVPHAPSLQRLLKPQAKVSSREVQKQVLESLAQKRRASQSDEDQNEDGHNHASKRLRVEAGWKTAADVKTEAEDA